MARWWSRALDSHRKHSEIQSIDRETSSRMRKYVVTFADGTQIWLRNVTSITKKLKSDALEDWAIDRTLDYVRANWTPDVCHSKEQIDVWLEEAREARYKAMRLAGGWGTRAHELIDTYLKTGEWTTVCANTGDIIPLDILAEEEPVLNSVQLFREWIQVQQLKFKAGEKFVLSLKHGFAGTLDYLGLKDPEEWLLDWKTGKGVYEEALLQMAAYGICLHEETGRMPDQAWILHISREGDSWKQIPCWRNLEQARPLAKHVLELANKNELEQLCRQRFKETVYQRIGAAS